ncbi:Uncharacterised protein [Moraxella caprae]|uniref:Uncharacterized protein n=1 Tax=Moraxella caprae TaxID=90240 RepID=A0A378R5M5_9GAMM|nr:hypothetical protein [Moraxella caprae]STZ09190.1 Uncharacterised protein [Moraxella caprae]
MTTKYVIRQNEFGYNDEWYVMDYVESSIIREIHDNQSDAETAYKKLTVHALRSEYLSSYAIGNGDAEQEIYDAIDAFTQERFGETFEDLEDIDFDEWSDDDVFAFAQIAGLNFYQIVEVDDSEKFYVIWFNHQDEYFRWNDDVVSLENNRLDFDYDRFGYHYDDLIADFLEMLNKVAPKGSLEELSDSPTLLEQLIDGELVIYKDNQLLIEVGGLNFKELSDLETVNALLKQPWFEIRALSIDEFAKL